MLTIAHASNLHNHSPKLSSIRNNGVYDITRPKSHPPRILPYTTSLCNRLFDLIGHTPIYYNLYLEFPLTSMTTLIGMPRRLSCAHFPLVDADGAPNMPQSTAASAPLSSIGNTKGMLPVQDAPHLKILLTFYGVWPLKPLKYGIHRWPPLTTLSTTCPLQMTYARL